MTTLSQLSKETVALMLQNSHGKMTMLPYQLISKYTFLQNFPEGICSN